MQVHGHHVILIWLYDVSHAAIFSFISETNWSLNGLRIFCIWNKEV